MYLCMPPTGIDTEQKIVVHGVPNLCTRITNGSRPRARVDSDPEKRLVVLKRESPKCGGKGKLMGARRERLNNTNVYVQT